MGLYLLLVLVAMPVNVNLLVLLNKQMLKIYNGCAEDIDNLFES